ncbi:MAG: helix-turn-helix transcriptional regulator [Verrucomicrobiales bacterium]
MNRIDRLTAMILMLQSHRVVTAEQMAGHFEISVRTVYRDVAALGEAGVPIVAEAGVGYALMRGYHMPPVVFTEEEAAAIFMSSELTEQFGDDSLKRSMRAAMLKIRAVLPDERRDYLGRLGNAVSVVGPSTRGLGDERFLMPVQEAVVRRRCLELEYDTGGRGEITQRTVEALGVAFYGRRWHLIGWCQRRQAIRDFRLDRIQSLEVLDTTFDGHEAFVLMDYLRHEVDPDELIPVKFQCDRWVIDRVLAEMPAQLVQRSDQAGGRCEIEALAYSLDWLAGWLLGLGAAAEVLSPEMLRAKVAAAANEIADRYTKKRPPENLS